MVRRGKDEAESSAQAQLAAFAELIPQLKELVEQQQKDQQRAQAPQQEAVFSAEQRAQLAGKPGLSAQASLAEETFTKVQRALSLLEGSEASAEALELLQAGETLGELTTPRGLCAGPPPLSVSSGR